MESYLSSLQCFDNYHIFVEKLRQIADQQMTLPALFSLLDLDFAVSLLDCLKSAQRKFVWGHK